MFAFFHSPRCSLLSTAKQSHRPPAASGVGRPGCRRRRGRPALVSFFVRFLGLPARVWTLCEVMRTPYTTTAPKTAAATPLPSLGSSDEPMTMWWPLANMLPMVLRIMMAKMEMTTLGCRVSSCSRAMYIFPAIFLHVASFSISLSRSSVPCPCVEGGTDRLHCGRGAAGTELVLVLVVSALSGAVWVFARASTAAISVEGY